MIYVKEQDPSLAKRLRSSRISAGFDSSAEFARHVGVNEATYRSHENGNRKLKMKEAKLYAKGLNVDWLWLYSGTTDIVSDFSPTVYSGTNKSYIAINVVTIETSIADNNITYNVLKLSNEAPWLLPTDLFPKVLPLNHKDIVIFKDSVNGRYIIIVLTNQMSSDYNFGLFVDINCEDKFNLITIKHKNSINDSDFLLIGMVISVLTYQIRDLSY